MAPNNALANLKPKRISATESSNIRNGFSTSKTSVLDVGVVESRGTGVHPSSSKNATSISEEIELFLNGEAKFGVTSEIRGFFTIWTFLTRLPGPTWVDHHPGYLMRGMAYFPLGGTLIGIFVSAVYDTSSLFLPAKIAACFAEAASLWVTGCFHEDGLSDSADGIGGGWSRAQILKIMQDTRLGTYGAAVLLLYVVTKLELLATLGYSSWKIWNCEGAGPALLVAGTVARLTSPILLKSRNYVDEGGPKYQFYSFMIQASYLVTLERVFFACLSTLVVSSLAYGYERATLLVLSTFLASYCSGCWAEYLLGGIMGDYLGATICVTEIIILTLIYVLQSLNSWERILFRAVHIVDDQNIPTLVQFFVVMLCTTLWCCFVGHPPVFVRESVVAILESTNQDDEIQIRLNTTTQNNKADGKQENGDIITESKTSSRSVAEKIVLDNLSTFNERYEAVLTYMDSLAKPVGSLGTLEDWAARLASLQRSCVPSAERVTCIIFCADHGVAASEADGGASCSSYPQFVTRKIIQGLDAGLAGGSVLSRMHGATLYVIDVGVLNHDDSSCSSSDIVSTSVHKLVGGTKSFSVEHAMSTEQVEQCLLAGKTAVRDSLEKTSANVFVFGEVGIGNTTTSSAILAALTGIEVDKLCDAGATVGRTVDESAIQKKRTIISQALQLHGNTVGKPMLALAKYGGAEIASLVGAILEACDRNIAVLVDGFIVSTAAAVAAHMSPSVCRMLFFATKSSERGQQIAIESIQSIAREHKIPAPPTPAIHMSLRLGEGTGAIMAIPILRSAATVLSDLGTLEEVMNLEIKK